MKLLDRCHVSTVVEDNFSGDIQAYGNDFGSGDLENQALGWDSRNKAQTTLQNWPDQAIADLPFVPKAPPMLLVRHQKLTSAGPPAPQHTLFPHNTLILCLSCILLEEIQKMWVLTPTLGGKAHNKGISPNTQEDLSKYDGDGKLWIG